MWPLPAPAEHRPGRFGLSPGPPWARGTGSPAAGTRGSPASPNPGLRMSKGSRYLNIKGSFKREGGSLYGSFPKIMGPDMNPNVVGLLA